MKKTKIMLLSIGLLVASIVQGKPLMKLMYWNGKNLELIYAKTDESVLKLEDLKPYTNF